MLSCAWRPVVKPSLGSWSRRGAGRRESGGRGWGVGGSVPILHVAALKASPCWTPPLLPQYSITVNYKIWSALKSFTYGNPPYLLGLVKVSISGKWRESVGEGGRKNPIFRSQAHGKLAFGHFWIDFRSSPNSYVRSLNKSVSESRPRCIPSFINNGRLPSR